NKEPSKRRALNWLDQFKPLLHSQYRMKTVRTEVRRIGLVTMENTQNDRLIPLIEWPKHHSYPPIGQLRWLVFHSETNGFKGCIRRVGRRILISEKSYFDWVNSGQSCSKAAVTRGR